MIDASERPSYWGEKSEKIFTRMHTGTRKALVQRAKEARVRPKEIIERAVIAMIASGDLDASARHKNGKDYEGCTYEINQGVASQLRLASITTGESIQTILHEALERMLGH